MIPLPGIIGFLGVGLALGLLGGGGGILAGPVLMYALGYPKRTAAVMSLIIVGLAAAFGALMRWRKGLLHHPEVAAIFAGCSVITAYLAARFFGAAISDRARVVLSIVTMMLAATVMWRRSRKVPTEATGTHKVVTKPSPAKVIPAALTAGALTGLIGVGGGFIIVPALTGILAVPITEAVAISLAVIVLNTLAAGIGYIGQVALDPLVLVQSLIAALIGMVIGSNLAPKLSARTLTRGFAILLVVASALMYLKEFDFSFAIRR